METGVYSMDYEKRGLFVIINNREFQAHTGLDERLGTDVDAVCLEKDFRRLGFVVRRFDNQRAWEMISIMKNVGEGDYTHYGALGVAFLTHGEDGILYGSDGQVEIEQLLQPLKTCRTLFGKPKLVMIQACRGERLDSGVVQLMTDSSKPTIRKSLLAHLPQEADFLIAYSTVSGYVSYRWGQEGSWFIHGLHEVLQRIGTKDPEDFADVLLRVSDLLALKYQTENGEKQMPCTVSTLRKRFCIQAMDDSEMSTDTILNINIPKRSISRRDDNENEQTSSVHDAYNLLRHFDLLNVQLTNTSGHGTRKPLSWQQINLKPHLFGRCSAVYRRCDYETPDRRSFPVFVAEECGLPPDTFRTSGHLDTLHMGVTKSGNNNNRVTDLFFVIHPNKWNPFQHRFINDVPTKRIHDETERLLGGGSLVQYCAKAWIGKYLLYLG